MDSPSVQLQETLDGSIQRALTSQRPILTHLNADTSWLVQLPYPSDTARPSGRSRWNIIFDPWWVTVRASISESWRLTAFRFQGPQSDVAKLFSTQWHTVESCVQNMAELSQRLQDIEARLQSHEPLLMEEKHLEHLKTTKPSYIDAVVISHEFTDHCNKNTLLELDIDTPIYATKRAVDLIRSWNYFNFVQEVPSFSAKHSDWRKTSLRSLPNWLGISQMISQSDTLEYHSAILLIFNVTQTSLSRPWEAYVPAEGIIYTPHGIRAQDLGYLPTAVPPIRTLALLHGLHDIKLSIRKLNLGAHNGLQAQRICKAKYWVSTHDEIKKATGFIAPWLYRNVLTLREALDEERRAKGMVGDESELVDVRGVIFADLSSGESLLLV